MTYSTSTLTEGCAVEWRTGANRVRKGKIVKVVPAGVASVRTAREFAQAMVQTGSHRSAFAASTMRRFPSFIIAIKGGKTDRAKTALYWPPASQLRPAASVP